MFRRLGPAYRPLLETHNALLREQCGPPWRRRGEDRRRLVRRGVRRPRRRRSRPRSRRRRAITSHRWPEGATIKVRIGVHTGMAFPHEGDYIALALHQASRVVGAANGGFVLVIRRDAVAAAGDDAHVADRARRHVPTPRLRPAGHALRRRAPRRAARRKPLPVRAVPAQGHNLIAPATTFVGRDDAIAEREPAGSRRVDCSRSSVPGGMGKTRLAVELGLRVAAEWPDGVWIADLSKATNGRVVAATVADALGVSGGERDDRAVGARPPRVAHGVAHPRQLRARPARRGTAGDRHPRRACPGIAILATSRQPLALAGEELWRIGPLPTDADVGAALRRPRSLPLPDFAPTAEDERVHRRDLRRISTACRSRSSSPRPASPC